MRRRVRVTLEEGARLLPGQLYDGRVIEAITVVDDPTSLSRRDVVVTLVGPQLLDKAPSIAELDHRFRARPWRP